MNRPAARTRLTKIDGGGPAARVRFTKVEGGGNDFILLDRRGARPRGGARSSGDPLTPARIRLLCDRHRGIGADGLLVLERAREPGGAPRVRYYNSDGGAAAFCGNGARCVGLHLLREAPASGAEVRFVFGRREYVAEWGAAYGGGRGASRMTSGGAPARPSVHEPSAAGSPGGAPAFFVAVLLPSPRFLVPEKDAGGPRVRAGAWIDSGVPHYILRVADAGEADLARIARPLRRAPAFGKGGSNIDLVEVREEEILVRTWERGVEGETLACGSGLVASAFWAHERHGLPWPIRLRSRGGDRFAVRPDPEGRGLWLEGPVRPVFAGEVALPRPMR